LDEYFDTWGEGIDSVNIGYSLTNKKGDINRDLTVDATDYNQLLPEFGKTGFSQADIDWDRAVDGVDYVIWLNNTAHTSTPSPSPTLGPTATPSPLPSPTLGPTATSTPTPTPIPGGNLLTNPGFEGGATGWTGISGVASIVASQFHTGTQSLQFTGSGQVTQIVNVIAGRSYTVSGWMKTNLTSGQAQITVFWRNSSGAPIWTLFVGSPLSGIANWTQRSMTFTAPAGSVTAQFVVQMSSGAAGTLWFDDQVLQ
jgi:hypothetical protein